MTMNTRNTCTKNTPLRNPWKASTKLVLELLNLTGTIRPHQINGLDQLPVLSLKDNSIFADLLVRAFFQAEEEWLLVCDYFPSGSLFSLIHVALVYDFEKQSLRPPDKGDTGFFHSRQPARIDPESITRTPTS
ncbi:Inactive leucine-rich repeat receptor-like serine/threonine-protein kinase [Acorus calamus]|uniref:Inactive leucine-rich repeat receptor-like serine/threonine-protein kinase n=1 Tax=Acorus calamus TaxID=4465 RepID=A0AAV9DD54_ACOCL|nr:Inactive leucine-rich repeat receptor-like serine/threonine-protein kinase [Acorus calamus]